MLINEKTLPDVAARWGIAPSGYVSDPEKVDFAHEWRREPDNVVQIIVAIDHMSRMRSVALQDGLTSVATAQVISVDSGLEVGNGVTLIAAHLLGIPVEKMRRLPGVGRLSVNLGDSRGSNR